VSSSQKRDITIIFGLKKAVVSWRYSIILTPEKAWDILSGQSDI